MYNMDELLFKNKTSLSEENYIKLLKFHNKMNNWKYWLYTAIFVIAFLTCASVLIVNHEYTTALFIFLIALLFIGYRTVYPYYKVEKEVKKDKIQSNLQNVFYFYDKKFEVTNEQEDRIMRYSRLYKVYENKEFFYMYLDKENALVLEKSGFEKGDPDSFGKFLKEKIKSKYKKINK